MLGLRMIQRSTPALRQPTLRQFGARRLNSQSAKGLEGAADNAFNRERQAVKDHAAGSADLWRKMSIYIVIPCLCIAGVNAYRLWGEHWEHKSHEPIEDRVEMPYMNIRTKNFFWGDGDKTAFWNPKVNIHQKDGE